MAEIFVKCQCTYCQEEITGLRVKCAECRDFELCLQCFSSGAEIGQHKNDHSYQFVDSEATKLTFGRNAWTAREELRLLDAVEVLGFGNWEDISKHIETRSPDEVRDQYVSRYLEGVIGKLTWTNALKVRPNIVTSTAGVDTGPLSPSTIRQPPLDISEEDAKHLGYMPVRDDFDREYDNDAESVVSRIQAPTAEDEDLDIALKLVHVDIYTHRLRERARRKRVARDYQLVWHFYHSTRKDGTTGSNGNGSLSNGISGNSNSERQCATLSHIHKKSTAMTQEEREFQEGMRVFSQFHTAQEHDQFLANMQREQELRIRLNELSRYRRNGITRHEECVHFEQELYYQQEAQLRERNALPNSTINGTFTAGSSGVTLNSLLFPPPSGTFLRKRERSADHAFCSQERRWLLTGLGSPYKDSISQSLVGGSRVGLDEKGEKMGKVVQPQQPRRLLSRQEANLSQALGLAHQEFITFKTLVLKDATEEKKEVVNEVTPMEGHIRTYIQTQGWLPV